MEELGSLCIASGTVTVGNSLTVPERVKQEITMWASISIQFKIFKLKIFCRPMLTIVHDNQKVEAIQMSINKWASMAYIVKYYSASKKKGLGG